MTKISQKKYKRIEDVLNHKFGKLTAISEMVPLSKGDKSKHELILCQCDCGNLCSVVLDSLVESRVTSCGCDRKESSWVGRNFGEWTVLEEYLDSYFLKDYVLCRCSCGVVKLVLKSNLSRGITNGCGLKHKKQVAVKENLIGKKFGRLTVIGRDSDKTRDDGVFVPVWTCRCDCGNIVSVEQRLLKQGVTKSCGCLKSELSSDRFSLKLEGKKFGRLTVLKRNGTFVGKNGSQYSLWLCQCGCGNQTTVKGIHLIRGITKSCGCMTSHAEEAITKMLVENDIDFISQFTFPDLLSDKGRRLKFDFAIFDKRQKLLFLLEYQGIQHYIPRPEFKDDFGKLQREVTDKRKKNYCLEHNLQLEEITYKQDIEVALKEFLKKYNLIK